MALAVGLFGLFVAALGLAGIVSPDRTLLVVTRAHSGLGLPFIAALRIGIGAAMWLAAAASRAPSYLQILGALAVVSGLATPFFGPRRLEAFLDWWRARPPAFVRVWSLVVLAFGLSLVWAVLPAARV